MAARDVVVHETADPEVVIGEFAYVGRVLATGARFTVHNVFVLRVRDGLIVESRDYADHLAFAAATGRLPSLTAAAGVRTGPASG
jgi:ketosteroid isomerase-like protein